MAKQILSGMIAVVVCWPAVAGAVTEITLRDRVAIKSSVVRLVDVAEIESDDEEQCQRLASLPLMPAPSVGGQRFLRKREVEDLLAAHGADLSEIRIQGAAQVTISGAIVPVEREDAREVLGGAPMNQHAEVLAGRSRSLAVAKLDAEQADALRQDVQQLIAVYLSTKTKAFDSAGCDVTCDVAERHLELLHSAKSLPICSGGTEPWMGRQRFVLSFTTAQGQAQIPVYAEVTPKASPVVVAVEPIARGAVITAAHIELREVERQPKSNNRRVSFDTVEKLIGMEARQAIPAGAVVLSDQVQSPVLVKRGELITISSQGNGIRVRATVRALQDRSQGELVQVESLTTKERFDARVVGTRMAAIVTINAPSEQAQAIETARR